MTKISNYMIHQSSSKIFINSYRLKADSYLFCLCCIATRSVYKMIWMHVCDTGIQLSFICISGRNALQAKRCEPALSLVHIQGGSQTACARELYKRGRTLEETVLPAKHRESDDETDETEGLVTNRTR